ncbi:MAG TPA: hypothetical protein VI341_03245, partial [Actinomycetota bacterium]
MPTGTIGSMRRFPFIALFLLVFASACDRGEDPVPTPSVPTTDSPSLLEALVPEGVPKSFGEDVSATDLPVNELVPPGTEVTDQLLASTTAGDAVVIMYAKR